MNIPFSVLKSSFQCQKSYVNSNIIFAKFFSVPDSPFSLEKDPLLCLVGPGQGLHFLPNDCRFGAFYWSTHIYL